MKIRFNVAITATTTDGEELFSRGMEQVADVVPKQRLWAHEGLMKCLLGFVEMSLAEGVTNLPTPRPEPREEA